MLGPSVSPDRLAAYLFKELASLLKGSLPGKISRNYGLLLGSGAFNTSSQ
jgi:hypothetical protein